MKNFVTWMPPVLFAAISLLASAQASRRNGLELFSPSVPSERIRWLPELPAHQEPATLHVTRETHFWGKALSTTLTLDGRELAVIANGENFMVRIPPGRHVLGLKFTGQESEDPRSGNFSRKTAFQESVLQLDGGRYHGVAIVPDKHWAWQLVFNGQ
jgi:hypothetical protein